MTPPDTPSVRDLLDLETLLVDEGVAASRPRIRAVLHRAHAQGEHLVAALVDEGIATEDVLADILARVGSTSVLDLNSIVIDDAALALLSWEAARERLLLPFALAGGRLRVACASPLDQESLRSLSALSGMTLTVGVAPVNALLGLIDRAYESRLALAAPDGASELAPEITRRVDAPSTAAQDAASVAASDDLRATLEQRHEALLLALIERGLLTRAEYLRVLHRLRDTDS